MAIGGKPSWGQIFMVVMIGVLALYLVNVFVTGAGTEELPYQFELIGANATLGVLLMVFKILVVGGAVWIGYVLANKLGQPLGKRDAFTLVLAGLMIWFVWDNLLVQILDVGSIGDITGKAALKMGLLP